MYQINKVYNIVIPYANCKKWLKIYVRYVDNPELLKLNTLMSDYPILKYLINDDIDIETMKLVNMEVLDEWKF